MNSKVLMIIGMHRSGTSLITQWVHRCGLHVGERLLSENVGNQDGHFEDKDFLDLHTQFLRSRKDSGDGFVGAPLKPLTRVEVSKLKVLIDVKSSTQFEWGWKEPRTCLFLSEYRTLIPDAYYMIVVRGFNDTVNSLIVREHRCHEQKYQIKRGLSKLKWDLYKRKSLEQLYETRAELYLSAWVHYNEQILNHIRDLPTGKYLFVHYEDLFANDSIYFDHLRDDWNFSLDYVPFQHVFKRGLLSETRNIEAYIQDKQLLHKARRIEFLSSSFCELFYEEKKWAMSERNIVAQT